MQEFDTRESMVKSLCKAGDVGAEIGVFNGYFSDVLLNTNPKSFFLIDCWQKQTGDYASDGINEFINDDLYVGVIQKFKSAYNVIPLRMFSSDAAKLFPNSYFDWIYLDANHSYDAVASDLKNWFPKIKMGGYFLGHDYIREPFAGLIQAVHEFFGPNLDFLTTNDWPSWGMIKRNKLYD